MSIENLVVTSVRQRRHDLVTGDGWGITSETRGRGEKKHCLDGISEVAMILIGSSHNLL